MNKKILTIVTLLVLALIVGALSVPVFADETVVGAKVENATAADTEVGGGHIVSKVTKNTVKDGVQTIEITYDAASLKVLDSSDDRPAGYAWIGVKVTRPEEATKATENDNTVYNEESFEQYFGVDVAILKEAVKKDGYISYTKSYTWEYSEEPAEANRVAKTVLTVKISAEGITLKDEDASATLWDENEYKTEKMQVTLDALRAELEAQGKTQAAIEEELKAAEELLAEQNLTLEELQAQLAELTAEQEVPEQAPEQAPEEPATQEKDSTPKTGVVDVSLISSVVAMISVAGIVTVKKYSK